MSLLFIENSQICMFDYFFWAAICVDLDFGKKFRYYAPLLLTDKRLGEDSRQEKINPHPWIPNPRKTSTYDAGQKSFRIA